MVKKEGKQQFPMKLTGWVDIDKGNVNSLRPQTGLVGVEKA